MPRVGVVGAGISGLLCAQRLLVAAPGLSVTVFEWGRGPGGRTARRRVSLADGGEVSFDHATPFFTASSPDFGALLREWELAGAAARWPEAGNDAWVGSPSNHAPCRLLSEQVAAHAGGELRYGRHVRAARHDAASGEWVVRATNRADGADEEHRFDALVLSDKLLLLPNPYAVLPPDEWGPLVLPRSLASSGTVVLMLALERDPTAAAPASAAVLRPPALPAPLTLLVRDSSKPGRLPRDGVELWVAHTTAEYAAAHLRGDDPPDLDDPPAVAAELQAAALAAIAAGDEGSCAAPRVLHAQAFAWDHAQPTGESTLAASHLLDGARRVGVCGDFFGGADGDRRGVEAAALSGVALAQAMAALLDGGGA